jgi:hypothetical protein
MTLVEGDPDIQHPESGAVYRVRMTTNRQFQRKVYNFLRRWVEREKFPD